MSPLAPSAGRRRVSRAASARTDRPDRRVHVLVCGTTDRGDDGAGPVAVAALAPSIAGLADICLVGQLTVDDLLAIPRGAPCLIVDAAVGSAPGGLVVLPLERLATRPGAATIGPRTSHELPIDQLLRLAAVIRGQPTRGTFVGLGGLRFGFGTELSPPVRMALPAFTATIGAEICRLATDA